jgi:cytochrome c-type biogenesis protein CcmH/NrfG
MTAFSRRAPVSRKALTARQVRPFEKSWGAVLALLVLLSGIFPTPGEAREERLAAAKTLLQQADAAYSAGERERARRLYQAVLASDPNNTRAVYQLARLAPEGSAEAIALLRRYVALEPGDAWGYMALGDALAKAGQLAEAIEQYHRARRQAPGESDVYIGLGRILRNAGRTDELVANYEDWVSRQPQNATAWFELGRARQQARRYPEAAEAYARSLAIKKDEHTLELLDNVLAESALALRPYVGRSYDSDDNKITRFGLDGDWQLTDRSRLGLHAEQAEVKDPTSSGTADEYALIARWQPLSLLRLDGLVGIARLDADQPGQTATNHPLRRLHLLWRSPAEGPALELRLTQNPLVATPGLVAQPVDLTEVSGRFELPLAGSLLARAGGKSGRLESTTDVNRRSGYQLGPVYRWRPAAEIGLSYAELGYDHPTSAGYFAPDRVQAVELGTYIEYERLWPLTFALDAGAGQQCVTKQEEATCGWIRTFRLWALVSWALKPGVHLDLELEHEDSPVAGAAATPTSEWKSNSAILSLRFGVRPRSARSFLAERGPQPRV